MGRVPLVLAWVDPITRVITFRGDITDDEARRIHPVLLVVEDAGLRHGYETALFKNVGCE